jgi:ABC-2 type transport system ATP-binding protein
MIEVEGLTKYYGPHPAISDVSFKVEEGEIVAFLGPNGAGKTTAMRVMTGYMPPTFGSVTVAGHDMVDDSLEGRRKIGYMPEKVALYPDMRVYEYLTYAGKLQGMSKAAISERMAYVLDHCGLEERRSDIIGRLSMGFRQRVGLAQAMLHNPPVLILDEPTVGLDPNQIIEVRNLIKNLAKDHTVMLSTHILPEAQMTCERVIIINHGKIVAVDTPEKLTAQIRDAETLLVRVDTSDTTVSKQLLDLPQVTAVRHAEEGQGGFYVDTALGADIRADLASFVLKKGWGLLELRSVEMTLEDVFRQLTTEEEGV